MQQKKKKDAAKSKVDEEVTKEKEIDQASTNSDVDQVKDKGTNGINSVVVEVVKKTQLKAIDELVKAKNQRLIIITMRLEKKKTQQNQK